MIRFTVLGDPCGKQRPRVFTDKQGKSKAITPQKTSQYEQLIKWILINTLNVKPLVGSLEAQIRAYYSIPKSMNKKDRLLVEENKLRPTKKPDLDNVAKCILDACNGIAYHDDSQVVKLTVEKYYGDQPRVEVTLHEI